MLDADLHIALIVIDRKCVSRAKLIIKAQKSLARIDEIARILPNMKANQV